MSINFSTNKQNFPKQKNKLTFKGPMDSAITKALVTIDTNAMVNAGMLDVGAMVIPRTAIDTKKRNKYAGFETFFREISGTVTQCFSAGVVALAVATIHNKLTKKKDGIDINPNMWVTNSTFDTMKQSWTESEGNVNKYVKNIFSGMSGLNGNKTSKWKEIQWDKVEWYDDKSWDKWKGNKWADKARNAKSGQEIVNVLSDLIEDKKVEKSDIKKVSKILEHRIANALQISQSVDVEVGGHKFNGSIKNIIRDTHELGKQIFNNGIDIPKAEQKLKSMNKTKSLIGVGLVAAIGMSVQYINRMITKKRTGNDNFVGDTDFGAKPAENKDKNKPKLVALKALASAGMFAMSMGVMHVKKPADLLKKLEFKDIVTSGNAIKTIYMAVLISRFTASRNETELRETCTRDYLGFLNWLVLGSFVSKGVAQLAFDKDKSKMFNIKHDDSKGFKKVLHWFNDDYVSLKSQAEIAAKGEAFAKKYMWKRNVAQVAGIAYSALALGCALPLFNIFITKKHDKQKAANNGINGKDFANFGSMTAQHQQLFSKFAQTGTNAQ